MYNHIQAEGYKMKIIFGYSKLSAEIAHEIHKKGDNLIIIEPNSKEYKFGKLDNYANKMYDYECFDDNDLIEVGIQDKNTQTLFCLHNDFNKNLFVTLSARNLNKELQIISLASTNNDAIKLKLAGATNTINPYETAAVNIFRKIHRPISLKILDDILYSNSDLIIEEIYIKEDSILNGVYFKTTKIFKEYNLVLLGLQDKEITNNFIFTSRGINHKIDYKDTIVVLGKKQDIKEFKLHIHKG